VTRGLTGEGVRASGEEANGVFTIEMWMDLAAQSVKMSLRPRDDLSSKRPAEVIPGLRFLAAFRPPHELRFGPAYGPALASGIAIPTDFAQGSEGELVLETVEALATIQGHTAVQIFAPDLSVLTRAQAEGLVIGARLLRGETVTTKWDSFPIRVKLDALASVDPAQIAGTGHGTLREIALPEFHASRVEAMLASALILLVAGMNIVSTIVTTQVLNSMLDDPEAVETVFESGITAATSLSLATAGVGLLALTAWAYWLSRVVMAMPALGLGYPAANGLMAFVENYLPGLNLFRVPAIIRDVVRRVEPEEGRGEALIFAAWIGLLGGFFVPRLGGFFGVFGADTLEGAIRNELLVLGVAAGFVLVGALFLVALIWWIEARIARRRVEQLDGKPAPAAVERAAPAEAPAPGPAPGPAVSFAPAPSPGPAAPFASDVAPPAPAGAPLAPAAPAEAPFAPAAPAGGSSPQRLRPRLRLRPRPLPRPQPRSPDRSGRNRPPFLTLSCTDRSPRPPEQPRSRRPWSGPRSRPSRPRLRSPRSRPTRPGRSARSRPTRPRLRSPRSRPQRNQHPPPWPTRPPRATFRPARGCTSGSRAQGR